MHQSSAKPPLILHIAVLGTSVCLDYLPAAQGKPVVGMRVEVRVRNKTHIGIILKLLSHSKVRTTKLLPVTRYIDSQALLDKRFMKLMEWLASYYHCPICTVLLTALPKIFRAGKGVKEETRRVWSALKNIDSTAISVRAPKQLAMLEFLIQQEADEDMLREQFANWRSTANTLLAKGLVVCTERTIHYAPSIASERIHRLNKAQANIVHTIQQQQGKFKCNLIEGVTGSGKTEIYLRLAADILSQGGQVMILLPEISLTPQHTKRFRECFGHAVVVSHSNLSDRQRYDAWQKMLLGTASIMIGTRSIVFTPCKNLQLMIVDEEHDLSYKQRESLRYQARDFAIKRAQLANIPIVLGSATPSLESLHNAFAGKYMHHQLPHRVGTAKLPTWRILNVRHQKSNHGLSPTLITMMKECLRKGEQVLLFLNRRGYAPRYMCKHCKAFAVCRNCELALTYHLRSNTLRCHHCGCSIECVYTCDKCGKQDFIKVGYGTERIEADMQSLFPNTECIRIDADTTRNKGALEKQLAAVHQSGAKILIGTQLLAKGHHFPQVTLVGLVNVDPSLFAFDFRALERLAQLIVQVSGRAGRASLPGKVVLQTCYPDNPELHVLLQHGYGAYAKTMLAQRNAVCLPPYSCLALFRAESKQAKDSERFLSKLAVKLRYHKTAGVRIFDPVPSPLQKKAGFYRAQLMLMAKKRSALHQCLTQSMPHIRSLVTARTKWHLDVDPMTMDE